MRIFSTFRYHPDVSFLIFNESHLIVAINNSSDGCISQSNLSISIAL